MSQVYRQIQAEIARIKGLMGRLTSELAALEQSERLLRPYYTLDGSASNGDPAQSSMFDVLDPEDDDDLDKRGGYGFPQLAPANPESGDLFGKKIKEAAIVILEEANGE